MKLEKYLPFLTVLVSVSSVLAWCALPIGNTFMWWVIDTVVLLIYYLVWDKRKYKVGIVNLFMCLVLCSVVYALVAGKTENYWDYKALYSNLMVFMLPLAAYAYTKPALLPPTIRKYIKYSPWILLVLWQFLESDAFGRFLVPYSFMALFLSELSLRNKVLVVVAYVITLVYGVASRSDIIKFSVCVVFGVCFYFKTLEKYLFMFIKLGRHVLLIVPFVFFGLAVTNTFNIFRIDEELGYDGKYSMGKDEYGNDISALADTRTFLYVEEIGSAIDNNYWLQGNSMARGYDSEAFGEWADMTLGVKRGERQSCEVSILNVFNYFGLIGCAVYFMVFAMASYKAIYKSKNRYVPVIGLYVAFRWAYAWVEDFSKFDLNYLFLWIMIGICFSPLYRNMTDDDFKKWVRCINKKRNETKQDIV